MEKEMRSRCFNPILSDIKYNYEFVMDGAMIQDFIPDKKIEKERKNDFKPPKSKKPSKK